MGPNGNRSRFCGENGDDHALFDPHSDPHAQGRWVSNLNRHEQASFYPYPIGDPFAYLNPDPNADKDCHSNADDDFDPVRDSHVNANPDPDVHGYTDLFFDSDGHSVRDGY